MQKVKKCKVKETPIKIKKEKATEVKQENPGFFKSVPKYFKEKFSSLKDFFTSLAIILTLFSLSSCDIIKGHQNTIIDDTINSVDNVYSEDNFVEEILEDYIEEVTDLELDFSPSSPEV